MFLSDAEAQKRGLVKVDFVAKGTPPTLDDICAAIERNALVASENVLTLFKRAFKGKELPVEQFNFGRLPIMVIKEAQSESFDFVEHGVFKPPYPICFYRCSVDFPDGPVGMTMLVVEADPAQPKEHGIATVLISHSHDHMVAVHSVNSLELGILDGQKAVQIEVPSKEAKFWNEHLTSTLGPPKLKDLAEGSMVMMGLTMILNTKGVYKDRVAPPAKPNAKRAKQGKILLPYVTRVHTMAYARSSVDPAVKGTHASPRPHRRRAHVRRYKNQFREWVVPIDAMLVNWDGKQLQRGEYEID